MAQARKRFQDYAETLVANPWTRTLSGVLRTLKCCVMTGTTRLAASL